MTEASIEDVVLHEATETRYLNYALSVITARALPDVRDGLKPVQRRILYGMFHGLRLVPEAKHRKSAAVVGEVMAKYHPHGDQSIYDAMVRMAQTFALRYPLVDGQGNFGSLDGDGAAAMRYTEAKLRHLAVELLEELKKDTVATRQNYDGTLNEPVVLPAQVPNLLINGATGIAVGMATNIPPHNLKEVVGALVALIDRPELSLKQVLRYIKGPDFPTGGELLNSHQSLIEIYDEGRGTLDLRGEWTEERDGRKRFIVLTSIPYAINKAQLIGTIADHIRQNKVPQLIDIRDESTEDVRIVMELKRGADPEAAMAYLYKKTPLQTRFHVNMTALLPTEDPEIQRPERIGLIEALDQFLDFRYAVTRRRLQYDLRILEARIHILRAFEIIFNDLDTAIRLIRESDGKADARVKLMDYFELDEVQAEAILETKLYKLAKMEIDAIREELAEKEAQAKQIRTTLGSEELMWELIRSELVEIRDAYKDPRRTKIVGPQEEVQYTEEHYIVAEDTVVMVTRAGWIKRQRSYSDVDTIRVREGDEIGWILPSSTRESVVVFTDQGRAYSMRVDDVPLTTGYGDAIQTRFSFEDGEQLVGVAVTDPRTLPKCGGDGPKIIAVTRGGRCLRFPLFQHRDPSTTRGRLYMRLDKNVKDDAVVRAYISREDDVVSLATRSGRCLLFPAYEAKLYTSAAKGVVAVKLGKDDYVLGYALTRHKMEGLQVETNRGRQEVVRPNKFSITARGNRGREIIRAGYLAQVTFPTVEIKWNDEGTGPIDPGDGLVVAPNLGQRSIFDDE